MVMELQPFVVFFRKTQTQMSRNEYTSRKIQLVDARKEEATSTPTPILHSNAPAEMAPVLNPLGQTLVADC